MKELPILFSAPMVRALLDGSKTQTRRVVKDRFIDAAPPAAFFQYLRECCPYGQPGDRLWVREAWMPDPPADGTWNYTSWAGCREGQIAAVPEKFRHSRFCNYAATWPYSSVRWTPSIHMPRWASRITLEITGVRAERLQDIGEADALAEGIVPREVIVDTAYEAGQHREITAERFLHGEWPHCEVFESAKDAYADLWEQINGPGLWDANPWVWAVEFKRIKP